MGINEFNLLILSTAVFLVALCLSYWMSLFCVQFCYKYNFLDYPSERKRHQKPIPFLGGVAVFLSFWLVVLAGVVVARILFHPTAEFYTAHRILSGVLSMSTKIGGIFIGSLLILIVGIVDDKVGLLPLQKLFGQIVAAVILMSLGLTINLFSDLGAIGYAITFVWILLIMNAFNFIDSLDGHCAGIAFISSAMFFWITQIIDQPMVGFFLITFSGALLGFLRHNFKPAKIFLGDNGSLFIGYIMAAFTLLCKYQTPKGSIVTLFIPVLIFGVPIYDTLSVIAVRLSRKIAPWQGDRNHFAHRLVKMGMSDRVAVIFSYFIAVTIGFVAILTTQVTSFGAILIGCIFLSILSVIAFLEYYAAKRQRVSEELAKQFRRRKEDVTKAMET